MSAKERSREQGSSDGKQGPGPDDRHKVVTNEISMRVRNFVEIV
jgi:hypothetical protein